MYRRNDGELNRLSTFSDWSRGGSTSNNYACPLILARLGFKYTGRDDAIICCHCQTEVRGWNTVDDVKKKHSSCLQHFDRRDEMSSIISSIRQRLPATRGTGRSSPSAVQSRGDVRDSSRSTPNDTTSTTVESNSPFYEVCEATVCRASRKDFSDIYNRTTDESVGADVTTDRSQPNFELLKVERARLATFHDWPERAAHIVEPRDLAKAGMFYTGHADRVQCAFCRGFLRNWEQGDDPAEEHRRHFPDCSIVRDADVGTLDVVDNVRSSNQYLTTSGPNAASVAPRTRPETGRQRARPKHPDYAQLQQRRMSFQGKQVPAGQRVEVLALAGFFHLGPTDNVRCFCCDGGLKHWQPTDDPWTEHRRWFARCPYVIEHGEQLPGVRNAESFLSSASTDPSGNSVTNTRDTATQNVQYHVKPREVKARLASPLVVAVMAMGHSRDLVRQAIQRRLATTGDDFPNAASLLEAVLELQAEREQATVGTQDICPDIPSLSSATSMPEDGRMSTTTTSVATSVASRATITEGPDAGRTTDAALQLEENRKLKEARTCKVCMDRESNTVFLPCGHLVCCEACAKSLSDCPICQGMSMKKFIS